MPDAVDPLGREQVVRLLAQRQGHRRSGGPMRTHRFGLSQKPLHGAAADLDTGAEHLPRYGAGAELGLRAEPPEFINCLANRIIDAVPDHGSIQ